MMKHKLNRLKKPVQCAGWLKKTMLLLVVAAFAGTLHLWTLHNAMGAPDPGEHDPNPDITYNGNDMNDIEYWYYAWPKHRSGNKPVPDDEADSEIDVIFLPWDCYDYTDDEVEVEYAWINWDGGGLSFNYTYEPTNPISAYSGTFKSELECEDGGAANGGGNGGEGGEDDSPEFTLDVQGQATQTLVIHQQSFPFAYGRPFILCVDDELSVESALQTNSGTTTVFSEWSVNGNAALNNSKTFDIPDDFPAAFLDTDGNANPARYDLDATYECPVTQETLTATEEVVIIKVDLDIDVDDDGDKDNTDEAAEDSAPGGIVFVNWDDDNNNGTCDYESFETGISGEDELVSIALSMEPSLNEGTVTFEALTGGSRIRIWASSSKSGSIGLPKEWDLASETLPDTLYVEAVEKSTAEGDTVLNLKWEKDATICQDKITLTCAKINLAVAAYRSPVEPFPFSPDFNHAAIVSGYGGTGPYGIDAAEGSGRRKKSELLTLGNYHIMEMPGAGQPAVASTLQDLVNQHDPTGWPGAGHEYLVSNPGLATRDDLRNGILDNTEAIETSVNGYCWNDAVEGPSNTLWNGTITGIEDLRCDGLVEVVYEITGVQVWGRDSMNYPIQTYPAEHNTIGPTLDPDRLSPIVQRDGVVGSPTRFQPQPLVEPKTMEPHE